MYGSVPLPGVGRLDKVGLRVGARPTRPTCQAWLLVPSAGADAGMGAAPGGEVLVVEIDEVEALEAGGQILSYEGGHQSSLRCRERLMCRGPLAV